MEKLVFTGLFSFCLSSMISGWVTYVNLGMTDDFVTSWGTAFYNAWPISFVAAFLLSEPVKKIAAKITNRSQS